MHQRINRKAWWGLVWRLAAFALIAGLGGGARAQQLEDATGWMMIAETHGLSNFDRTTRKLTSTSNITATLTSPTQLLVPVRLIVDLVTSNPALVAMPGALGAPGQGPYNTYYFDLSQQIPGVALDQGEQLQQSLTFVRDVSVQFTYRLRVLALRPPQGENGPPQFTSDPLTEGLEGAPYYYQARAIDPESQPLSFEIEHGPSGMTLTTGGLLAWIPAADQVGPTSVTLLVKDPFGASDAQQFDVNVAKFNRPPLFTSVPERFAKAGEAYIYPMTAADPEGEALAFTLEGTPPAGASAASDGQLTWTPGNTQLGDKLIEAKVADPAGANDIQSWTVHVYKDAGALQVLSPSGEYVIAPGETLELEARGNYAEADFEVAPVVPYGRFLENRFEFKPTLAEVGFHVFTFTASFDSMRASSVVTIEVRKVNHPPVLDVVADQSVTVGGTVDLQLTGSDPDDDPLTFSAPGLNLANALFNPATRRFTFSPQQGQGGTHAVAVAASDGTAASNRQFNIHVTELPVEPDPLTLTVNPPVSPTFQNKQDVSGQVGGAGVPPPPPLPEGLIGGLSPAAIRQGESATVEITGFRTQWIADEVAIDFGSGLTVEGFEVLDPTHARATVRAGATAALGSRAVIMRGTFGEQTSVIAFQVEGGVARLSGRVLDDFTSQPLQGATVAINGTKLRVLTDAAGHFDLTPMPQGAVSVIVTRPNYAMQTLDVALGSVQSVELDTPVLLHALARPPQFPGSIPRGPNVASVLDRGVGSTNGGLTIEQAVALIQDTVVAVGGNQVGILDAHYRQLNPKVEGVGMFSMTPVGVGNQARWLVEGKSKTLGDVVDSILTMFRFTGRPMSVGQMISGLQLAVDDAWANPNDPASGMAIILFNEGASLSGRPPKLTHGTVLNALQEHLLLSSFIVYNYTDLTRSVDAQLAQFGIDPEKALKRREGDPQTNLLLDAAQGDPAPAPDRVVLASLAAAPAAEGDGPGGVTLNEPNDPAYGSERARQTYEKVWKNVMATATVEMGYNMAKEAFFGFVAQTAMAALVGGTGGVAGAVVAIAINSVAAAAWGAIDTLIQKMLVAWMAGQMAVSMTPEEPNISRSELDDKGNLVIYFDRSTSESYNKQGVQQGGKVRINVVNDDGTSSPRFVEPKGLTFRPELMKYTYQLYRFPSASDLDVNSAQLMYVKPEADLDAPQNDPKKPPLLGQLKFTIPKRLLKQGANYFRIATYQVIKKTDEDLVEGVSNYDRDADGSLSRKEFPGDDDAFAKADKNHNGAIEDGEISLSKPIFDPDLGANYPSESNLIQPPSGLAYDAIAYKQELERQTALFKQNQADFNNISLEGRLSAARNEFNRSIDEDMALHKDIRLREQSHRANVKVESERIVDLNGLAEAQRGRYLDFETPGTPAYKEAQRILGNGNVPVPEEVKANLIQRSVHIRTHDVLTEQHAIISTAHDKVSQNLGMMEAANQAGNTNIRFNVKYDTLDASGNPIKVNIQANADADGIAQVKGLQGAESHKSTVIGKAKGSVEADLELNNRALVKNRMGPLVEANNLEASQQVVKLQAIQKRYIEIEDTRIETSAKLKAGQRSAVEGPDKPFEPYSQHGMRATSDLLDVAGALEAQSETVVTVLTSVRALSSDFSACHVFINGPAQPHRNFPPPIAITNNAADPGGLLRAIDNPDNAKDGLLEWSHPYQEQISGYSSTGFPSDLLDVDEQGRVYVLNRSSTTLYGGRIFRFDTFRGRASGREFIGAAKYFSLSLQYSRPTTPIAMAVGPQSVLPQAGGGAISTQDLFLAEIDPVDGKRQILRVPISYIDRFPAAYPVSGQSRYHLAGQPFMEDAGFRFSGPSEMELGPAPQIAEVNSTTQLGALYLSDETAIYCMYPQTLGGEDWIKRKIIDTPGRRWAGIAFDGTGKMYFSDFANGEIFCLTHDQIRALDTGTSPTMTNDSLKLQGWQLFDELNQPGALAIEGISEHSHGTLFVSYVDQVERLPLPIVGRFGANPAKIEIKRLERKDNAKVFPGSAGQFAIPLTFDEINNRHVSLRVRKTDPATLLNSWKQLELNLPDNGVNFLNGVGQ